MSTMEGPLTAAHIYTQITGGPGPDPLQEDQAILRGLRKTLFDRVDDILALVRTINEGFQGPAGEAATNAARPVIKATQDDVDHLAKLEESIAAQLDAFHTVRSKVQPVSDTKPELTAEDLVGVLNGKGMGGYEARLSQWDATNQANIEAFSDYYNASVANIQQTPAQYGRLADPGTDVSVTSTATGKAKPVKSVVAPASPATTAVSPQTVASEPVSSGWPVPSSPAPSTPAAQIPTTQHDDTRAAANTPRNQPENYQFGPTGSVDPRMNPAVRNDRTAAGSPEYLPGIDYQAGTASVVGKPAPGRSSRTGPAPGRSTGASPLRENSPSGAKTSAGASGRPGQSAPPGVVGPGKGKEEDKERKRAPYLRNTDPEGTFGGSTEKPVPPVIGEPKNQP